MKYLNIVTAICSGAALSRAYRIYQIHRSRTGPVDLYCRYSLLHTMILVVTLLPLREDHRDSSVIGIERLDSQEYHDHIIKY